MPGDFFGLETLDSLYFNGHLNRFVLRGLEGRFFRNIAIAKEYSKAVSSTRRRSIADGVLQNIDSLTNRLSFDQARKLKMIEKYMLTGGGNRDTMDYFYDIENDSAYFTIGTDATEKQSTQSLINTNSKTNTLETCSNQVESYDYSVRVIKDYL